MDLVPWLAKGNNTVYFAHKALHWVLNNSISLKTEKVSRSRYCLFFSQTHKRAVYPYI